MPSRKLWVVALVLAAACGGGEPSLTAGDVARIMPSAADAPARTELEAQSAGPQTLDEFISDATVRDTLRGYGFRVAYVAQFATPGFTPDPSTAPIGTALYSTSVIVLRDAPAARKAFHFYEERLRTRAKGLTPLVVSGFGTDTFAFHFSALAETALPGLAYLWRVGNALFSVVGVGNPGPDAQATRDIAGLIERRATE